jgi:hypothetical protein
LYDGDKLMASNVKLIKLTNRDEILAEVLAYDRDNLIIKNPVRIVVLGASKADPKTPNVGIAPWAEFSEDKDFAIDRCHVLCIMTPVADFLNQYNSIFGGIIAPASKLILPGQ